MQGLHLRKSRTVGLVLCAVVLYVLLRPKKFKNRMEFVLDNTNPYHVWEFMADFTNMKLLNPTLKDFDVLDDGVDLKTRHWKYRVKYDEYLHQMPYVTNTGIGSFHVYEDSSNRYHVDSTHKTCFMLGLYCLKTTSEFIVERVDGVNGARAAKCIETLEYECPQALRSFCNKEVQYQRQQISENLKKHSLNQFAGTGLNSI